MVRSMMGPFPRHRLVYWGRPMGGWGALERLDVAFSAERATSEGFVGGDTAGRGLEAVHAGAPRCRRGRPRLLQATQPQRVGPANPGRELLRQASGQGPNEREPVREANAGRRVGRQGKGIAAQDDASRAGPQQEERMIGRGALVGMPRVQTPGHRGQFPDAAGLRAGNLLGPPDELLPHLRIDLPARASLLDHGIERAPAPHDRKSTLSPSKSRGRRALRPPPSQDRQPTAKGKTRPERCCAGSGVCDKRRQGPTSANPPVPFLSASAFPTIRYREREPGRRMRGAGRGLPGRTGRGSARPLQVYAARPRERIQP